MKTCKRHMSKFAFFDAKGANAGMGVAQSAVRNKPMAIREQNEAVALRRGDTIRAKGVMPI